MFGIKAVDGILYTLYAKVTICNKKELCPLIIDAGARYN